MKKKKGYIIIAVIVVILILIFLLFRSCNYSNPPNRDSPITESKSLDFIPKDGKVDSIIIPAINGINLKSGQLQQKVDFYNPEGNPCYFQISLYLSDDTLLWQSEYIAPSENITDITLNQELKRGIYQNCRLVYDCFSLEDKSKLNGGEVKLEINSF